MARKARRAGKPDELQAVIRREFRSRHRLARVVIDHCLVRLPHYQGLPAPLLAEVRKSVLHHMEIWYRITLETGRPLTAADIEVSLRTARQRASQGVPLGEFLSFFLVGLTLLWKHLMAGVAEDPQLRARLLGRVEAILSNQTQLMTALTEAYVEERERLSRFREQDLDDFFQLLCSEEATANALEARARALGIPLGEPLAIAVIGLPAAAAGAGEGTSAAEVVDALASQRPRTRVWVGRAPEGFAALLPPELDAAALAAAAHRLEAQEARIGVGRAAAGIAGLRRSADEARRALRLGGLLQAQGRVYRHTELAVLDLVGAGSGEAEAFMHDVLGPLADAGGSRTLLETLRQLSASGYRIKLAAAALGIHPHTLTYRIKQIGRRFGLDLDDPETRLRVHLSLLILDAHEATGGARRPRPRRRRKPRSA